MLTTLARRFIFRDCVSNPLARSPLHVPSACTIHTHPVSFSLRPPASDTPAKLPSNPSSGDRNDPTSRFFRQRRAEYMFTAVKPQQYSHLHSPEVTFAGRSNVGKSSLINAILRTKTLVKTSKRPGHTSALNFFSLASDASPRTLTLVDMPGYGYRSRDEWGKFIMDYLGGRQELKRVFMLVEAKVGKLKQTDLSFLELVEDYNVQTQIVLTKTDKMKQSDLDKISEDVVAAALQIAPSVIQPKAIHCSSRSKDGIHAVQREILKVCNMLSNIK